MSKKTEGEDLQKAIGILSEKAAQYSPKSELWYVCYINKDELQVEEPGDNEFCENCKEVGLDGISNLFVDKGHRNSAVVGVKLFMDSCPEKDDFVTCCNCGHYITTSVLHTFSNEADHWLSIRAKDFRSQVLLPMNAWVIIEMLENEDFTRKHPGEQKKLIKRINKLLTQ